MGRGHTAEEKIKILYEDSLVEIREITGKIETLVGTLATIGIAIDKQKQGELSAAVRKEIAKAGDVQTARNDALAWAIKLAAAGAIVFSVAGFFAGYGIEYGLTAFVIKEAETRANRAQENAKVSINEAMKNAAWVSTEEGRAAYLFYKNDWPILMNCNKTFMEKVGKDGCRMVQKYGWLGGNESPVWPIAPAKN